MSVSPSNLLREAEGIDSDKRANVPETHLVFQNSHIELAAPLFAVAQVIGLSSRYY